MLLQYVVSVGRDSSVEHAHSTVKLEQQSTQVPPVGGLVPRGSNQHLGRPKSDGLDAFGKVLRGPARYAPVAKGDVELGNPRIIFLAEVIAAKWCGWDRSVPILSSILLRNGNFDEVARLDERTVSELDKDVLRLNIYALISMLIRVKKLTDSQRRLTCVDDIVLVGKIKGRHEFDGEPPHHRVRDHAFLEPGAEAPHRLSHKLKDKTHMSSVRPLVLEVVDEMANILVAELATGSVAKMSQDLPLEYGLVLVVGLGTEHLEGEEFVLVIGSAAPIVHIGSQDTETRRIIGAQAEDVIDSRSGQVLDEPDC